jgi:hypothetical protein
VPNNATSETPERCVVLADSSKHPVRTEHTSVDFRRLSGWGAWTDQKCLAGTSVRSNPTMGLQLTVPADHHLVRCLLQSVPASPSLTEAPDVATQTRDISDLSILLYYSLQRTAFTAVQFPPKTAPCPGLVQSSPLPRVLLRPVPPIIAICVSTTDCPPSWFIVVGYFAVLWSPWTSARTHADWNSWREPQGPDAGSRSASLALHATPASPNRNSCTLGEGKGRGLDREPCKSRRSSDYKVHGTCRGC